MREIDGAIAEIISIHALLAESDPHSRRSQKQRHPFLSTLSLRRATGKSNKLAGMKLVFLSTLSLRRATPRGQLPTTQPPNFYPRSPCGERLMDTLILANAVLFLSTLSLRRATLHVNGTTKTVIFLSTLSLRRATISCAWSASKLGDFYPRSPCGERLTTRGNHRRMRPISIHALLAESDSHDPGRGRISQEFLSTLSLRRATKIWYCGTSIGLNFYPRSPCGERPDALTDDVSTGGFLSTLSLRRATVMDTLILANAVLFLSTLSLRRATSIGIASNL